MTHRPAKILCIVGARPNFIKIAPIMAAFRTQTPQLIVKLVHTGQHYDRAMNERFFEQLEIPKPDICLDVGSGTHAVQTAEIMKRFEPVLDAEQPDIVLVVGDVNSTIACALVAAKKGIKVVHVEAGLRSRDRSMPEEINRILTDQLSDRLYITEIDALDNLRAEGIAADKVVFVGNVMIDTLFANRAKAVPAINTLEEGGATKAFFDSPNGYALLTLHRPSNVDDAATLARLLGAMSEISRELPIVFPAHPRTKNQILAAGLGTLFDNPRLLLLAPLGYLEMLGLMVDARLVLTDSGGVQEETTALGIPCLTLRENTERPITVTQGTNQVVGTDPARILAAIAEILAGGGETGRRPEKWDGQTATRMVSDLASWSTDIGW